MANNYQRKAVPVSAFQFTGQKPYPFPVFDSPWNDGPGDSYTLLATVEIGKFGRGGKTWLRNGDWIVTFGDGSVERYDALEFARLYEPIPQ